jgi:ferredoxin
MVFIDPGVCVDCGACIPVCPVRAIYDTNDLPTALVHWIEINAALAPKLPPVVSKQDPLPGADERKAALGIL